MKSFTDARFAFAFNRLVSSANVRGDIDFWEIEGVAITRERHNHRSPGYAFSLEVFRLHAMQRPEWDLIVVRQHWWGPRHTPIRSSQWAKLLAGNKAAALGWFSAFERAGEPADPSIAREAAGR
ncbi:MAG: hypothetical protein U1E87_02765 [Alphaproteobacteria bacterium]